MVDVIDKPTGAPVYFYVLTLQVPLETGGARQGTFCGTAWGPDRKSIFEERMDVHCKELNAMPDHAWVLCWSLELNEFA